MPYADPEKQRAANRANKRKERARRGMTVAKLPKEGEAAPDLPEPPSREFLLKALGIQAREGNVPAIRLLLEEYRRNGDSDEKPAKSVVDQLAAKRATRAS